MHTKGTTITFRLERQLTGEGRTNNYITWLPYYLVFLYYATTSAGPSETVTVTAQSTTQLLDTTGCLPQKGGTAFISR